MSPVLPLFPLSTVLYPGLVLPLQIFEERYVALVQDLLAAGDGQSAEFGVLAIKHGRETEPQAMTTLYHVGCVARVRRINDIGDGRYTVITTGTDRFRLLSLQPPAPYPNGIVERLDDPEGGVDDRLVQAVQAWFERYLELVTDGSPEEVLEAIPDDPRTLSYLIAATMALSLGDRQRLLEAPDARERLIAELDLLEREYRVIRALDSLPATDFRHDGYSPN